MYRMGTTEEKRYTSGAFVGLFFNNRSRSLKNGCGSRLVKADYFFTFLPFVQKDTGKVLYTDNVHFLPDAKQFLRYHSKKITMSFRKQSHCAGFS